MELRDTGVAADGGFLPRQVGIGSDGGLVCTPLLAWSWDKAWPFGKPTKWEGTIRWTTPFFDGKIPIGHKAKNIYWRREHEGSSCVLWDMAADVLVVLNTGASNF